MSLINPALSRENIPESVFPQLNTLEKDTGGERVLEGSFSGIGQNVTFRTFRT